jgi:hypothetical protein
MHGSDYECILRVIRGNKIKRIGHLEEIALNDSIILKWTLKSEPASRLIWLSLRSSTDPLNHPCGSDIVTFGLHTVNMQFNTLNAQ